MYFIIHNSHCQISHLSITIGVDNKKANNDIIIYMWFIMKEMILKGN